MTGKAKPCPKCGSEMTDRLGRREFGTLFLSGYLCLVCGYYACPECEKRTAYIYGEADTKGR